MRQQKYFMERWLLKKAEQTAKDTFEKGVTSSDLPEINIATEDIKKGVKFSDRSNR